MTTLNYLLSTHLPNGEVLIDDDTIIYIVVDGQVTARARWYYDSILRYADHKITRLMYNAETNVLRVTVTGTSPYDKERVTNGSK